MSQEWPPPAVISDGNPLLQQDMTDEIVEYLRSQDRETQAIMTIGFISLVRFLMAEIAEACHTASVMAFGGEIDLGEGGEVEVEVDEDDTAHMQLSLVKAEEEVTWLMQRDAVNKQDRWYRLLHRLQKELAEQDKEVKRSHLVQLRARIFHVVDPTSWTAMQEDLYALVLGMMDASHTHPPYVDEAWMDSWGQQLHDFIPGMNTAVRVVGPVMVDTPPEPMNEEEIQQHLADEDMEKKRRVAEEEQHQDAMARWQAEEDEMLRRQAALYQAWEDWEMNQHMAGGPPARPRLRKRCVLELEVASSSSDGPRRTQVIAVPDDGHVTLRLRAAMVEEVDESEASTVVLLRLSQRFRRTLRSWGLRTSKFNIGTGWQAAWGRMKWSLVLGLTCLR